MTTTERPARKPHFNHVAMSVPADLLDEQHRTDIVRFYDEVFGFKELPTETEDRKKLVLSVHTYEQFVFLIADDQPMACPRLDHYGISVDTEAELDDMLARARAFEAHDDRVDIVEREVDRPRDARDHQLLRRLPAADDDRSPVVGLQELTSLLPSLQ